ncbi:MULTISPECIES: hypothetical protein [Tenacibaculum]|uniref:hypothetical protein n=1 Tax=Tenacibaculum TaxID=104267 RepID=UPI001F0A92EC|nr:MULTISPECIES: hypothetical protein [Tenacibaculum]MCH3880854.1 hypothetical protein [Tenacibaculum aquimarinum]MDO6599547.1 hypothetical protein [Tenacibaculum sp. 1_MG-2023]
MIRLVERKHIDVEKYDACIQNAQQSNIFAFSWYLDIVTDNWSVFVLEDYEAVMPVTWRRKYLIKYAYQPLWTLQLGIFSTEIIDENEFLIELFDEFKYTDLRMNSKNSFTMFQDSCLDRYLQYLTLNFDDATIFKNYKSDRKKDLRRAKKADLTEKWNDNPANLIQLFKENIGKKAKGITEKDYGNLLKLMQTCIERRVGELLSIYDSDNKLVASGFFLKDVDRVSILVSSTDFKNRKNGANTFLIDRAIFKYRNGFKEFGFGGSSISSIAKYFNSFGAKTETYQQLKKNNLPKFIRFFKK